MNSTLEVTDSFRASENQADLTFRSSFNYFLSNKYCCPPTSIKLGRKNASMSPQRDVASKLGSDKSKKHNFFDGNHHHKSDKIQKSPFTYNESKPKKAEQPVADRSKDIIPLQNKKPDN